MKAVITFFSVILISCTTYLPNPTPVTKTDGKAIAFSREKGNCLACHEIADGEFPGNIGPPLKNMTARFKTKTALREQIWDATQFNPETSMPPFGKNKILSDDEIDRVVDYLWALK